MKRISLIALLAFVSNSLFAQSVWTGSGTLTTTSGSAGVGTNDPQAQLEVYLLNGSGSTKPAFLVTNKSALIPVGSPLPYKNTMEVKHMSPGLSGYVPVTDFYVETNGTVGINKRLRIGTTAASDAYENYKLSVDGDMIAKRCVIQVTNWADYVFEPDYALPELSAVEKFIGENKHLPGIPSQKEVLENGIELGKMNEILLKKIEELTLYTIKLQKDVDQLNARQRSGLKHN